MCTLCSYKWNQEVSRKSDNVKDHGRKLFWAYKTTNRRNRIGIFIKTRMCNSVIWTSQLEFLTELCRSDLLTNNWFINVTRFMFLLFNYRGRKLYYDFCGGSYKDSVFREQTLVGSVGVSKKHKFRVSTHEKQSADNLHFETLWFQYNSNHRVP